MQDAKADRVSVAFLAKAVHDRAPDEYKARLKQHLAQELIRDLSDEQLEQIFVFDKPRHVPIEGFTHHRISVLLPTLEHRDVLWEIAKFLGEKLGDGCDWPDVSKEEKLKLLEVIRMLLFHKFKTDVDGHLPVEVEINWKRESSMWCFRVPHRGTAADYLGVFARMAAVHSMIADTAERMARYQEEEEGE